MERAAGSRSRPRLLRTYARRGGPLRRLPAPAPWLSPPQDRGRLFASSSTSLGSTSSGSEDPDFQPCRPPPARRPSRPRPKRGGRREPPASEAKENRGLATPLRRRVPARRLGPRARARAPLLCSTPQPSPPGAESRPLPEAEESILGGCRESPPAEPAPRRRRHGGPRNILAELSSMAAGSSGAEGSGELSGASRRGGEWRAPSPPTTPAAQRRATTLLPGSSYSLFPYGASRQPEAAQGDLILVSLQFPGRQAQAVPTPGQPLSPPHKTVGGDQLPRLTSQRAQRTTPGPGLLETGLALQKTLNDQGAALPVPGKLQVLARGDTSPAEPQDDLRRGSLERRWSLDAVQRKHQLQPVVVLDSQAVPLWVTKRKISHKKLDAWSSCRGNNCQQPVSPFALSVISETKSRSNKVIPREDGGGTSRKACISGFSSSRWGKQARRQFRRKNIKTPWQYADVSFQEQMRQRGIERDALEVSSSLLFDRSFLNDSQAWARARASLSLHKKKKVAIEEGASGSIPSTPSFKSQLVGYRKSPFIQSVGYSNWPTSSVLLLTPMKSHSVLEVMLTDAEKVYGECQQEGPISFEECIPLDKMKNCLKIGEGVFGEVFQTTSERGAVALKIIPVEGTKRVNGEAQKNFSEILPEMIISKELSLLSQDVENRTIGFIDLYSVHCVQGAYPEHLLKAWDKYHELNGSENDRPDLFGEQQLFMVLEFEFGGNNLEDMRKQLNSVATAKSLLHQVTASLAVAEEALHFEHRDLHWGNILVKKTSLKELSYTLNGAVYTIPTKGIQVNIIDYTLSRMEKDGLTVFCDISTDKELFQGRGDYQFDVYRQMKEENSNNWADYHPHSNVLWLHYVADKLLKEVKYKRKTSSSSAWKAIQKELQKFHREVLNFSSAGDVLLSSSFFQ